jgi:hypothetical protein
MIQKGLLFPSWYPYCHYCWWNKYCRHTMTDHSEREDDQSKMRRRELSTTQGQSATLHPLTPISRSLAIACGIFFIVHTDTGSTRVFRSQVNMKALCRCLWTSVHNAWKKSLSSSSVLSYFAAVSVGTSHLSKQYDVATTPPFLDIRTRHRLKQSTKRSL